MLEENTRNLISETVNEHLQGYKVTACNIDAYETSDGEAAISVGVCYDVGQEVIDPELTRSLLTKLNEVLLEIGDERFPYIRHYLTDEHQVVGNWNTCGTSGNSEEVSL